MNGLTSAHERDVRRAFRIGAALGVIVFVLVLSGGERSLLAWNPVSDFYDAQAESFLDGRLDIDPAVLTIEAFEHDGRSYMYQPPWPAILRLPVVAVTDRFEGRLAGVSMLLALGVLLVAAERVLLEARRAVRDAPSGRLERMLHLLAGLLIAGGWVPTFLASRPWVYHEAAMWGLSWATVAIAGLLALRRRPTPGAVLVVAAGCTGAVMSRATVGAGACAAVGLVAVLGFFERRDEPLGRRLLGPAGAAVLLVVAAIPALAYALLNTAKFGTPASIPFESQGFTQVSAARQAMLAENGGSLFGFQFSPTTLLHYLRPNGIRLAEQFPFVDFPPAGGPIVGDVTFDLIDHTASIPAAMPAFVVGAVLGLWALLRRRVDDPFAWLAIVAGGVVGSATIIPFGYIAQRYHADVVPLLLPLAALGLQMVAGLPGRAVRRAAGAAVVVLAGWTLVAHVGLATSYQRLRMPNPAPEQVAGLLDARLQVGADPDVRVVDVLPAEAGRDDVAVLEGCRGVYVWTGTPAGEIRPDSWVAAERTGEGGHVQVEVELASLAPGQRHVLARWADDGAVAWIQRTEEGVVTGISTGDLAYASLPVSMDGPTPELDVVLDPALGDGRIRWKGRVLTSAFVPRHGGPVELRLGEPPADGDYAPSTTIVAASSAAPRLCERLVSSPG